MASTFGGALGASVRRAGPEPYLAIGLLWLGIAHLAATIKTVEPIYLWVLTQVLLLEKLSDGTRWLTELLWLAAYVGAAMLAWILVEGRTPGSTHRWRRASLAWLAIQVGYAIVAAFLVWLGVIYE